ncbi:MAG: NAD(P)-dependent alcohol dehydrogenase [Ardenticatenaceae bacterium]|nr:NAD(P)-dependent alcohol dehydrogenase [Ardenticatenaceae bacterium]
MKAIVCTKYGPPEFLQLRDVPKPEPKKNEICVKIFATAVTASDCIVRGFKIPVWRPMGFMMGLALGFGKPRNPILGMVLAGEVESVGKDVKQFKPGDSVYGMTAFGFGTYAEYKCLSETACLVKKPARVSYQEAAAVTYGGLLAGHFIKKGNIQKGQKVLIYGASGSIGTTAVQLARHFGAEVTGVCSTANLEWVKSLGANAVIDYTKEDLVSKGERYDFIFDAVGKSKSSKLKAQCKDVLTANGKYVSVDDGSPKSRPEYLELLNELMEAGHFTAVIDRCYPLEQIAEAHRYVDEGHKKGNVVITVANDDPA